MGGEKRVRKADIDSANERPTPPPVNPAGIPAELRELAQWLHWRLEWKEDKAGKGKWSKVPRSKGKAGSSSNPTTWMPFEAAVYHCERLKHDGVGFVFAASDPFAGVDLDDCRDPDTGALDDWAAPIVAALDSYTEVSPSGTGVKVWVRGKKPPGECKRKYEAGEVEIYDQGRYFAMTGRRLDGTPATVNERQGQLEAVYRQVFPEKPKGPGAGAGRNGDGHLDDDAVLARAARAKNGPKFLALWGGDTSGHGGDDSKADAALCALLAFWCRKDAAQMDRLFRRSGLFRPDKWDERHYADGRTYGEGTIAHAVESCAEVYEPNRKVKWGKKALVASANGDGQPPEGVPPGQVVGEGEADPLLSAHLTDVGNGQRLVALHGADLRYCHPWGKWLCWDGRRWREDDEGRPELLAKDVCRELLRRAAQRAAELAALLREATPEEGEAIAAVIDRMNQLQAFALRSEAATRLAAMVGLAQSEPGIPIVPDALNGDRWLLNCVNGTVDLQTGELRPHRREDHLTALCPTPYAPKAACPTWLRFLNEVFPESGDAAETPDNVDLIAYAHRFLGSALTGDTREQILTIFWGAGANGKSTLLNAFLDTVGPDYFGKLPATALMVARGERHPTELAGLFGKRLAVATETAEGARLNEALVKELTGGDPLTVRRMREDFWSFVPTHKLVLCTNHRPRITGRDHAIRRRLRLVPFTRRFEAYEQDKGLPEKLRAERPGILAWLVRGCRDWQVNGLTAPRGVTDATAEYVAGEDVLRTWLAECCATDQADFRARAAELYGNYRAWSERSGERFTMTCRQFAAALREEGYDDYHNNGLWFRGLCLHPNQRNDGTTE
jgi:putative DNA primase/helicase